MDEIKAVRSGLVYRSSITNLADAMTVGAVSLIEDEDETDNNKATDATSASTNIGPKYSFGNAQQHSISPEFLQHYRIVWLQVSPCKLFRESLIECKEKNFNMSEIAVNKRESQKICQSISMRPCLPHQMAALTRRSCDEQLQRSICPPRTCASRVKQKIMLVSMAKVP
jgi:hypothetical protein